MKRLGVVVAIVFAAACGKVLETPTDGATDDAGDAPPDVSVPGTVRVTVLDRAGTGAPAVGSVVVFVDPDGTQTRKITDGNGQAEAEVFAGASVTSIATASNGKTMVTVLAIAPGDEIVLGNAKVDVATAGTFVVNWTQLGGANDYEIYGPCGFQDSAGAGVTTKTITLRNDCNPTTMELLIRARNSANATIGFSAKSNISVAAGSTAMPAFVGGLTFTASYTNLSKATELDMDRRAPDGFGFGIATAPDITGLTSVTTSAVVPTTGSARVDSTFSTPVFEVQEIHQRLAGNSTTYGLDLAATALPWINKPMLDVAAHTIAVSADNTGTSGDAPDLVESSLAWRRGNSSFSWTTFGPTVDSIVLPALGGDEADAMPAVGDALTVNRVKAYDADTIADYAAIREAIGAALEGVLDDAPLSPANLVRTSQSSAGN